MRVLTPVNTIEVRDLTPVNTIQMIVQTPVNTIQMIVLTPVNTIQLGDLNTSKYNTESSNSKYNWEI